MKISVYTISDCQFSVQEKEYLKSKNIAFEEKNLESNRDFLTEMLAVSNNFAGTPVTKIEKDDGQIVVLKGFTKEEFDKALGTVTPPVITMSNPMSNTASLGAPMAAAMPQTEVTPPPASPVIAATPDLSQPAQPTPAALNDTLNKLSSAMGTMPTSEPVAPITPPAQDMSMSTPPMAPIPPVTNEPVMPQPVTSVSATPEPTTLDNPALNNILSNLEQKVATTDTSSPAPVTAPVGQTPPAAPTTVTVPPSPSTTV